MANALTYIRNVGKSIGYASIDVLKEKNPVFHDFAETNGELASDMYKSVRDLKKNIKDLPNKIMESEYGKFAVTFRDNLFEDLKSGKFYNKERQERYEEESAGSLLEGIDMDVFDDFGQSDGGKFDLSGLDMDDDTPSSNEMMDIVGQKSSFAVSNAIARSAEYIVEGNSQAAKASYKQMSAIYGGLHSGMSTINQNIAKLLEFSNENLNMHIENSKTFYGEITRMDQERNQYLKEIAESLKQMNEPNKSTTSSKKNMYTELVSYEGVLDLSAYGKYASKNFKNATGLDMLDLFKNNLKLLAASPLQAVAEGVVNYIIPKTLEKSMETLNKSLSGMVANGLMTLKEKAYDNEIWSFINDIFGIDTSRKSSINTGNYEKGKVPFDGVTRKAIIEVIPTYLSKILSTLTGQKRDTFDYDNGKFVTVESLETKMSELTKRSANSAADDLDRIVKDKAKNIKFANKDEEEQFWTDWENAKLRMYKDQKRFETRKRGVEAHEYGIVNEKNFELFKEFLDGMAENLAYPNKLYRQVAEQNRQVTQWENYGTINAIENNSIDKAENNTGKGLISVLGNSNTAIIDKLNEIYKELAFIRLYGSGKFEGDVREGKIKADLSNFTVPKVKPTNKESKTKSSKSKKNKGTSDDSDPEGEETKSLTDEEVNKESPQEQKKKKKTLSERIKALRKTAVGIVQGPLNLASSVIDRVDTRLYELVYGPVGGREERDEDDDRTLTEVLFDNLQNQFDKFGNWMQEKIFDPISNKTFKENAHDAAEKFLKIFGIDLDSTVDGIKKFLLGIDEDGNEHGFFGKFVHDFKATFTGIKDWIKGAFTDTAEELELTSKKSESGKRTNKILEATEKELLKRHIGKQYKDENGKIQVYTKEDAKNGKKVKEFIKDSTEAHAMGVRRINKTGLAILSKGELVIPDSMNPLDIAEREQEENNVKRNLGISGIPQFAKGGTKDLDPKKVKEKLLSYKKEGWAVKYLSKLREQFDSDDEYANFLKNVKNTEVDGEFERKSIINNSLAELLAGIEYTKNNIIDNFTVSDEDKQKFTEKATSFLSDIKEHGGTLAAGATIGAGVSLLTGLVGGPLVGAAAGAGTALIIKSKAVQNMLFGDEEKDGLLPKNLTNAIKKYLPDAAKGGAMGGLISLIPGIPGGPIAGMIVGSALGFAKNSESIQDAIFGKDGIGLTKDEFMNNVRAKLPKMGAGALAGLIAGPFGLTTNILLGSALGFASDTDGFKNLFFGEIDPATGKRDGGLIGEIVKPVGKFLKDTFIEFKDFFFEKMLKPVVDAFNPIKKQLELLAKTIGGLFKDHIVLPLKNAIMDTLIKPMGHIFNFAFKPIKAITKFILGAPSAMIGGIGNRFKMKHLKSGNADYIKDAGERLAQRDALGKIYSGFGKDIYREVDEELVTRNADQLRDASSVLSSISQSHNMIDSTKSNAYKNISAAIKNANIPHAHAREIKKLITSGRYQAAIEYIKNPRNKIPVEKQNILLDTIKSENSILANISTMRKGGAEARIKALQELREQGTLNLSDEMIQRVANDKKEANKILKYIQSQGKVLEGEGKEEPENTGEKLIDQSAEQHKETISKFDELIEAVLAASDPKSEQYKKVIEKRKKHYDAIAPTEEGQEGELDVDSRDTVQDFVDAAYDDTHGILGKIWGTLKLAHRARKRVTDPLDRFVKWGARKGWDGAKGTYHFGQNVFEAFRNTEAANKFFGYRNINPKDPETYNNKDSKPLYESAFDSKIGKKIFGLLCAIAAKQGIDGDDIKADKDPDNILANIKNKFKNSQMYQFVNGKVIKYKNNKDGEPTPDKSDSQTKETLQVIDDEKQTQKGIFASLKSIPSALSNLFTNIFGDKDKGEKSLLGRLIDKVAGPAKIALVLGLAGWAKDKIFPGIKAFWDEKAAPYLDDAWNGRKEGFGQFIYFFNPKNPEGLLSRLNNFVQNTLPNIVKTAATYVSTGLDWALKNVLPGLVSTLITNLPVILKGVATGIVSGIDGLLNAFRSDKVEKHDGRMADLDGIINHIGSNAPLNNISSSNKIPSWFDKKVATKNDTKIINTVKLKAYTPSYLQTKLPKAFDHVNDAYKNAAIEEYENVKNNTINTEHGPMTVAQILDSDKVFGYREDGSPIYGYEYLKYNNLAQSLGMDIQLSEEEMEENTKAHGGGNEKSTTMSKLKNAGNKSFLRGIFGLNTGVKGASKVISGGTTALSKILSKFGLGGKVVGKVIDAGGSLAEGLVTAPNKLGNALNIKGTKLFRGMEEFGAKIFTNSMDNLKSLDPSTEFIPSLQNKTSGITGLFSKIKNKIPTKLQQFIIKSAEALKGFFEQSEIYNYFSKVFGEKSLFGRLKSNSSKLLKELGEYLSKQIPDLLTKYGGKLGAKAGIKLGGYIASGTILLWVDGIASFIYGWNNAHNLLGVTKNNDPGFIGKLVCAISNALNEVFCLGLLPIDVILQLVNEGLSKIGLDPSKDLKEKQEESRKEVDAYNEKYGTNFETVKDFNKKDSLWNKTKRFFGKIFGKKDKEENISTNYNISTTTESVDINNSSQYGSGSNLFGKGSGIAGTFISQIDSRYRDKAFNIPGDTKAQTLGDSGCAPAAAAMVVNSTLGKQPLTMEDASNLALKYKVKDDGVSASYFKDEFARHGIYANYINSSDANSRSQEIYNQLMSDNKVVLMGQDTGNTSKVVSPFGPNPHYVVATGLSKDGKHIFINDPESNKPNIKYSADRILNSSTLGIAASVARGSRRISNRIKQYIGRGAYASDTIQYKVWNALRAAGYNEIATAAAMGNIEAESGFRADAIEKGSGVGFGLVQWSYGRRTALEKYAKERGINPSSLEIQIEYLLKELGDKSGIWTKASAKYGFGSLTRSDWANGNDLEKATKAFMCCFERPSYNSSVNHIDRRLAAAKKYYEAFTGTSVDVNLNYNTSNYVSDTTTSSSTSSSGGFLSELSGVFTNLAKVYGIISDSSSDRSSYNNSSLDGSYTPTADGNVSTNAEHANLQRALVDKMYSVQGKLKYAQNNAKYPGSRNPEDGSGDCSSTVQWAYKNILGVDPGSWTGAQTTDSDTYTVATSTKDESKLQLGDLLLKDGHVEMYAGNNTMIGHGGGKDGKQLGPVVHTLDKSGKYNIVRRWVGFKGSGSGLFDESSEHPTNTPYDSALRYIKSDQSNSILPFGITEDELDRNKTSIMQYNSNKLSEPKVKPVVKPQTQKKQVGRASQVNAPTSNDVVTLLKQLLTYVAQIAGNTNSIESIIKLISDYFNAVKTDNTNSTEETKKTAVLARQNLINAVQSSSGSSSSEPNAQLLRLIEATERIARE